MEKDKSKNKTKKTKIAKYRIAIKRLSLTQDRIASPEGLAAFLALPGVCDDRSEGILLLGRLTRDARADLEAGRGDVIGH